MNEVFYKSPLEEVFVTFDFGQDLATDELVNSATLAVRSVRGLDLTPEDRLSGAVAVNSPNVQQLFVGGILGELYEVTCLAQTDAGQTLELRMIVPIRDPADT
jgi:hypothetical protein